MEDPMSRMERFLHCYVISPIPELIRSIADNAPKLAHHVAAGLIQISSYVSRYGIR